RSGHSAWWRAKPGSDRSDTWPSGPRRWLGHISTLRYANIGAAVTSHPRLVAVPAESADVEDPGVSADDLAVIFECVLATASALGPAARPRKDGCWRTAPRCRGAPPGAS